MFWKNEKNEIIKRHIIESKLKLDVDVMNNKIKILMDNELESSKNIVSDFLNNNFFKIKDNIAFYDFLKSKKELFLDEEENLNKLLSDYLNFVSFDNEIINDSIDNYDIKELDSNKVYLFNNDHIIVRKKTSKVWIDDLENIITYIEDSDEQLNSVILNLLSVDNNDEEKIQSLLNNTLKLEDEVLFPLPSNDDQYKIVNRVGSSNLVLVQGPPGTGKSHTIANLISNFIANGKKVVVTSEKAKALEVIREKLPEEIRSLSLALLSNKALDKELEYSIDTILKMQSQANELGQMNEDIVKLEKELKEIRNKKVVNEKEIITLMHMDTISNKEELKEILTIEVNDFKNDSIAKWLNENKKFEFIPKYDTSDFKYENLELFFERLDKISNKLKVEHFQIDKNIEIKEYLSDNSIDKILKFKNLNKEKIQNLKNNELDINIDVLNNDIINKMLEKVSSLKYLETLFEKSWISENLNYDNFTKQLKDLLKELSDIKEISKIIENNNLIYLIQYNKIDNNLLIKSLNNIFKSLKDKEKISTILKISCKKDFNELKKINYTIHGDIVDLYDKKNLEILLEKLNYDKNIRIFSNKLKHIFEKDLFEMLNINIEYFGKNSYKLENFINEFASYFNSVKEIDTFFEKVFINNEISCDKVSIDELEFNLKELELIYLNHLNNEEIAKFTDAIYNDYSNLHIDILDEIILMVNDNDLTKAPILLNKMKEELNILKDFYSLKFDYNVFFNQKNNFIYKYIFEYNEENKVFVKNELDRILKYKWVDNYYKEKEEKIEKLPNLYIKREELFNNEKKLIIDIIEKKGWYNQISNMTTNISTSLSKWISLKRKYGKGTGKNASRYLDEMQKEMKIAKSAIPVWIMPIETLVAQYPFSNNPDFDVIIMDESSQSPMLSISALTRGKKVIIVGDDKQISPINVGITIETENELRDKYLRNSPWKLQFDGNTSIYDIAQHVCGTKKVVLTEHFRCLPEIINFSNYQFYNNEINPLKIRSKENTIKLPIKTIFVENGVCIKSGSKIINLKEVEKIVEIIANVKVNNDYDGKSIGIIVLQNSDIQIQKITESIMNNFGEQFIRERKLKIGTSKEFQGDEKDVIILSMVVSSLLENGEKYNFTSLTKKEYEKSYNVAASRAKEQMILVHSVKLSELKPECNRYKILEYCQNYNSEKIKKTENLFDSVFEKDIYYSLKAKGIELIPQLKVGKYRIDFVIENEDGIKIAIECDGDKYHGIEQLEDDIKRQTVLERCGWKFIRIRASVYYYNKEESINKLIEEINNFLNVDNI